MNITEVPFSDSEATPPGLEVLSFDALLDRARGHRSIPARDKTYVPPPRGGARGRSMLG